MPNDVPPDAMLCRFIRETDWSESAGRPKADLFKQPVWSVWDVNLLTRNQTPNNELRLGEFKSAGQLYFTAGDYLNFAREAVQSRVPGLSLKIVRRPDDTHVPDLWRRWAYAHVEVDTTSTPEKSVLTLFRRILTVEAAKRARKMIPPDKFAI
jgi:hypothetical protein